MTDAQPISIVTAGRALVQDALRVLKWRLPALAVLTLASAAFEGVTLAMLLPLLAVLGFGGSGGDPISRAVIALFGVLGVPFTPVSIALLLLGLLAVSAVVFLLQAHVSTRLQAAYVAHWQRRLFEALARADWPFLRRQRAGDIVDALTTEAQRLGGAFYQANLIATALAFLAVQVAIAAAIAPVITAAVGLLAVLLFALTRRLVARALCHGAALTGANSDLHAIAGELVGGMKLVKATAHEREAAALIERAVARIEQLSFRNAFDVQVVRAIFEYASGAMVALLLIAGPLLLGVEIGVIVLVVAMFVRLFPKVTGLRQCIQSLGLSLPAFVALRAMLQTAEAARERDASRAAPTAPPPAGPAALRFDRVSLRGDDGAWLLREIDLDIPAGAFVAVVGATGAGKTTLIDCALGLLRPAAGAVTIDGVPLAALDLAAWRRSIGYLGQDPVLFAGSVRDNVRWGREGGDDAAVEAALHAADAGFVFALPGGLDADLGELGRRLSGGERQRLALARAFYGRPRLLILDEATGALDMETERNIVAAVAARRGKVTVLAITHRIAPARACDRIVMLEAGRIVEQGSFSELAVANGRFARFFRPAEETAGADDRLPAAT